MAALLPSEVLAKAADLIEPEGRWIQGAYAKDAVGEEVYPPSGDAVCFCTYGALYMASGRPREMRDAEHGPAAYYLRRAIGRELQRYGRRLDKWNDRRDRTQAEVVAALRKAADLARSEGQ